MEKWHLRKPHLEVGFALLVLGSCIPFWATDWLPLQDLPQHLAAIRVLHDYNDPSLGFSQWFTLTPMSTQYVGFYYLAVLFSYLMDVVTATRVILTLSVCALPYAMRLLLRKLERPEWLALFVIPAIFNTNLILGFLNFIAALPLMIVGLALAFDLAEEVTWKVGTLFVLAAVGCFLMHVLPFGILIIGTLLIFGLASAPRKIPMRLVPLVPVIALAALWSTMSRAGGSIGSILQSVVSRIFSDGEPMASYWTLQTSLERLPSWLLDMVRHPHEETIAYAYFGLMVGSIVVFGVTHLFRLRDVSNWRRLAPLVAVVVISWMLYFILPVGYDWVWPIAPRFALVALLMIVPLIPVAQSRQVQYAVAVLIVAIILAHVFVVYESFDAFEREEVGDFDEAIAHIPKGKRVAGLIFEAGSQHIRFSPFLHSVARLQCVKGGAVMFTFADFPQSPFQFREGDRPPRVRPRWEWTPDRVNPYQDLEWYDYVLTRGGPGSIASQEAAYVQLHSGERWSVWRRRSWN